VARPEALRTGGTPRVFDLGVLIYNSVCVGKDENGKDVDTQCVAAVERVIDALYCLTVKKK
jgi:hypothetical protein